MTIFLETNDENLIEDLGNHFEISADIPVSRLLHMKKAAEGLLLFSANSPSPMRVGPVSAVTPSKVMSTLEYVERKKNDCKIFSRYLGGLLVFPRDVFVISNTKTWENQVEEILEILPDTWWPTSGFIAVNNADKLVEAYERVFPYSTFIAVDKASKAKLEYTGIEYVDATHLGRTKDDGLWFRELTRRPENWSMIEDPDFKRKETDVRSG